MKLHIFLKKIVTLFVFSIMLVGSTTGVQAQCSSSTVGNCISNQRCVEIAPGSYALQGSCGSAIIGGIDKPKGVDWFSTYNTGGPIGIIGFANLLLRLITIIAGIWVMFNFIVSGWMFITSNGDTGAMTQVREKLMYSVIGLAVVAGAYTLAGLIGLIFFGDAGFILNPQLYKAI